MRTDADLRRDVEDELAWDPQIESSSVGVAVSMALLRGATGGVDAPRPGR